MNRDSFDPSWSDLARDSAVVVAMFVLVVACAVVALWAWFG